MTLSHTHVWANHEPKLDQRCCLLCGETHERSATEEWVLVKKGRMAGEEMRVLSILTISSLALCVLTAMLSISSVINNSNVTRLQFLGLDLKMDRQPSSPPQKPIVAPAFTIAECETICQNFGYSRRQIDEMLNEGELLRTTVVLVEENPSLLGPQTSRSNDITSSGRHFRIVK